jgi:hypothetical protein
MVMAAHECVLCLGGDPGGPGVGCSRVKGKYLAAFLLPCVDSQGQARVNPGIDVGQVVVEVGLANLCIRSGNVLDKHVEVDMVQALNRIKVDCVEYFVDGGSKLVVCGGADEAVGSPRFVHRRFLCPEFLVLMGAGAGRYNRIQRRFGCWYVK